MSIIMFGDQTFDTECRLVPDTVQSTTMATSHNEKQKKQEVTLYCKQIQSEVSRGRSRSERMKRQNTRRTYRVDGF